MSFFTLRESDKPLARLPIDYQVYAREQAGRCLRIKRVIRRLVLGSCLALTVGCSATGKTNTFILTADLPPNFAYAARANYVPARVRRALFLAEETLRLVSTWRNGELSISLTLKSSCTERLSVVH